MSNHTLEAMRWIDDLKGPYDLAAHQLVFRFCQNLKSTVDEQGAGGVISDWRPAGFILGQAYLLVQLTPARHE